MRSRILRVGGRPAEREKVGFTYYFRMITRERSIGITVALLFGAVAFVYGLRLLEWHMTFHPAPFDSNRAQPPPGAANVWFTTADGVRLHGWYFENSTKPDAATIIFFHGNGGNISNVDWVGQRFYERGFSVLLFDYRGYGASEGDAEGETSLYADGDAAVAFLINEKRVQPERLVLYGQSLGTTVVADVASRQKVGAVILESGLSSASSMADHALPWLPQSLHFLGKNRFESAQKLAKVKAPVLITHGDPDPVIPVNEARVLFAAAVEPKRLLIFPGAGHNVFGSVGDPYLDQIVKFINQPEHQITAR
ncbi:MAG TPA: alpha/beta hydrolase [Pyrinomonadaceae bacterium]|nr:alpha/beta hydrolase [Pyrinomonadaceae bacterium]